MNKAQNRTDRKTMHKMVCMFAFFLLIAAWVVGRLASYQIKNHDYYQSKVLNQLTIQTEVTPERGTITDRNGNILATNITVYNVILSPYDIITHMQKDSEKNSDNDPENDVHYEYTDSDYGINYSGRQLDDMIAEVLSKYLDVDKSSILEKTAKVNRYYEVVKKNVDADIAEKIETFIAQFDLLRRFIKEILSEGRPCLPRHRLYKLRRRGNIRT